MKVNRLGEYNPPMSEITQTHLERHSALRVKKEALGMRLMELPEKDRITAPSDGGFSPTELMEHLAKAEEFNLVFLRKVSPKQIANRMVKPGPIYRMILKSFQDLKRVAAPPMLKPSKTSIMEAEFARWKKGLDEVETFLAQVPSADAPFIKMNFLFGTLSPNQFLDFQEAHIKYHDHYFPVI